jgi:hypothetical protein
VAASGRLLMAAVVFGGVPAAEQRAPLFQPPLLLSGQAVRAPRELRARLYGFGR